MQHGFIKVAAATPRVQVADPVHNAAEIAQLARRAAQEGVRLLVSSELSLTGYTCGDLFLQRTLLQGALDALLRLGGRHTGFGSHADCGIAVCPPGHPL